VRDFLARRKKIPKQAPRTPRFTSTSPLIRSSHRHHNNKQHPQQPQATNSPCCLLGTGIPKVLAIVERLFNRLAPVDRFDGSLSAPVPANSELDRHSLRSQIDKRFGRRHSEEVDLQHGSNRIGRIRSRFTWHITTTGLTLHAARGLPCSHDVRHYSSIRTPRSSFPSITANSFHSRFRFPPAGSSAVGRSSLR
jgi:hypothetical protein